MSKKNSKRICILVDCLTGGGAEKVAANLSKSLFDAQYQVSIISLRDGIDYDYKGKLYYLSSHNSKFKIIRSIFKLYELKKTYNKIDADVYIDFRIKYNSYKELLYHLFVFKSRKTILTLHSIKLSNYMPQHKIFYNLYNRVKAVVVVSKGMMDQTKSIYNFSNLHYIPNFFSQDILVKSEGIKDEIIEPFIIAVGRLRNKIKQFDKLILTYKNTIPAKNNIPLYILGDGEDKTKLERIIKENNLEKIVKLLGFKENPYPYIKSSKFLLLSSKLEGFGLVLVEALALETPVISFDCKSGPSEIIKNNENGILVKDQDFQEFGIAIDKMYSNSEFYKFCKTNSRTSVNKYSNEEVFKSWENLINS